MYLGNWIAQFAVLCQFRHCSRVFYPEPETASQLESPQPTSHFILPSSSSNSFVLPFQHLQFFKAASCSLQALLLLATLMAKQSRQCLHAAVLALPPLLCWSKPGTDRTFQRCVPGRLRLEMPVALEITIVSGAVRRESYRDAERARIGLNMSPGPRCRTLSPEHRPGLPAADDGPVFVFVSAVPSDCPDLELQFMSVAPSIHHVAGVPAKLPRKHPEGSFRWTV